MGLRSFLGERFYTPRFWGMAIRYLWFRLSNRHVITNGMVFMAQGVELRCTRGLGHMEFGRRVWIGKGTAIRCHEGFLRIGEGVVFGEGDTVNCYLDVEIGDECIFADDVYVGDFDHRYADLRTPIQRQGIAKSPVRIGSDCWLGTKSVVLRGTTIGEGSVVGAGAVVRGRYPERSVIVGNPARLAKRREG
jgi:acetyltransferase-like isoleucine patch superfamily enzyme